MDWILFVKKENVSKAEHAVKDDLSEASRQSIIIKDAKALDIDKDGSFFLIGGSEEGVNSVKKVLQEFSEDIDQAELDKALAKIKEEEDKALEGFGGIFG
ncbi:MAG: hypothetical protein JW700_04325 [Candidatus Aenigmarchaeota archaeon]|nr:hypothetical protein [Candidatus Aenigmarchaeota archaeon]